MLWTSPPLFYYLLQRERKILFFLLLITRVDFLRKSFLKTKQKKAGNLKTRKETGRLG
jgi:hypothetical protein